MPGPLKNGRYERYAQLLAKGGKQHASYLEAGFTGDEAHASRLAARADVRARIAELKARIAEKVAEKTAIDAAWLLERLAEEATADVADLYDETGKLKPVSQWPLIWRQGLVAGLDVESIGAGAGQIVKLKLSDRVKRLELIGKHVDVQAFKEKIEVAGGITVTVSREEAAL